jgi:hypothetical protein
MLRSTRRLQTSSQLFAAMICQRVITPKFYLSLEESALSNLPDKPPSGLMRRRRLGFGISAINCYSRHILLPGSNKQYTDPLGTTISRTWLRGEMDLLTDLSFLLRSHKVTQINLLEFDQRASKLCFDYPLLLKHSYTPPTNKYFPRRAIHCDRYSIYFSRTAST